MEEVTTGGGDDNVDSGGVGGVPLQGISNQDDGSNVQSTSKSHQSGAISKSSDQIHSSTQINPNPSVSSNTNHKCPDSKCTYKTSKVFNMRRHVIRNHPNIAYTPPHAHTCPACPFGSNKPTNITKHVNTHHPGIKWMPRTLKRGPKSKGGPRRFKCPQYDYQSNSKHNINRHQQTCHERICALESARTGNCRCLECGERLFKILDLRRHLSNKHGFIFKTETMTLDSYQEFEDWKASIEIAEGCSFTKTTGDKVIQGSKRTQYFQCNRSGMFRANHTGKRRHKWQGSCKIQRNCTSTMVASILESGKVEVECVCTHYSHEIELQHVWEPKGCKRENSALKSSCKQLQDEIIFKSADNTDHTYGIRHVLSNQEIPDIVDSFATSSIQGHQVNDQLSLLSWIRRWASSSDPPSPVLLYKIEGNSAGCDHTCNRIELNELKQDDFLLVLQSQLQKEMMIKFGPNGLYCDSVMVTKFVLITLQVVDDIGQALPVAWCLSNHGNTNAMMKIFFTKLKLVCGDLIPSWFMSPWSEQFYKTWMSVFGPVCRHLLCPWSVEAAWTAMLKKTTGNVSEYTRVHKLLKMLLEQRDEKVQEDHLQALLDWLDVSAKRQEFKRYFLTYWVSRKQEWTYCSNKEELFLPQAFMESFFQRFHHKYSHGDPTERLDSCVFHLLKYAQDYIVNRHICLTKGKPVLQTQDMQKRHEAGLSMEQSCVRPCPEDSHRWDVIESNQATYTIQESASICKYRRCPIFCLPCHICFHQYYCTCLDNLTNFTICKHIHLVHSAIHKGIIAPVRNTQWLKHRIQSRVNRLVAVVSSTGDEHYSVLQELDGKLGLCSSLLDARLLWGPTEFVGENQELASQRTEFVWPRQEMASQSAADDVRKEKRRISSGDRLGLKKKHIKQQGSDVTTDGRDKDQKGAASVAPAVASGSGVHGATPQASPAITTTPPRATAPICLRPAAQQVTSMQQQTQHQMSIPQPSVLTSDPHTTSQPSVMTSTSHVELQSSQASGVVSYPSPRPMASTNIEHSHLFTSIPRLGPSSSTGNALIPSTALLYAGKEEQGTQATTIIAPHQPGSSIPASHHPQLSGITSYPSLRPILPSQLSPGSSQHLQVHVDIHQTDRPQESQQLATLSDEQLSTLAGVASALFGDS